MSAPTPPAIKVTLRTAAILLAFTLLFTGLMAAAYQLTKSRIDASAQEAKLKLINDVLPKNTFNNPLLNDFIQIPAAPDLGITGPSKIYRARQDGQPVALVFEAAAPDGYSGHIGLIIALKADGSVSGVRVTDHKETPGLGDYIDPRKDKNKTRPWITQFDNKPADTAWKVKKDGGEFDYMTGATISARAVTQAVSRAAQFVAAQRERLFTTPTPAGAKP